MGLPRKWKTKDGTKIWIKDMSTDHILNSIKFLDRKYQSLKNECLKASCFLQGDMASYYLDQQYYEMEDSDVSEYFPVYESLVNELQKRGSVEYNEFGELVFNDV